METLTPFGALMLQNELNLLKTIVGIGFFGWMMLMLVQVVWLDEIPSEQKDSPQKPKEEYRRQDFLKAA
ncbi:MAG: hypothetical protein HY036_02225 [Nitrospirae bacterium]|nr:hypothetical protein [Nitrospirota bacterium]MBI3351374.1 hypothetical protein [Nitrospirota bacterium]